MADIPPEVALENTLNDVIASYDKLKKLTAAMMTRRDTLAADAEREKAALRDATANLDAAVTDGRDDEALRLISARTDAEGRLAACTSELEQAEAEFAQAKTSLQQLREDIDKLKAQRHTLPVEAAAARAQTQLGAPALELELATLDKAREHIRETVALASLNRELADADPAALSAPATPLKTQAQTREEAEARARAQLEELKRARDMAKLPKTMGP